MVRELARDELKQRLSFIGIMLCIAITLSLLCLSLGSVEAGTLMGLKPAQSSPVLYIRAADDSIYAFNAYSGQLVRHYLLLDRPPFTFDGNRLSGGPGQVTDSNGVVYYDGFQGVYAANIRDGSLLWHRNLTTVPFGNVFVIDVVQNQLFVQSNAQLYVLNSKSGSLLWQYRFNDLPGKFSLGRVVHGGNKVFAFVNDQSTHRSWIYVLRQSDGALLWKQPHSNADYSYSALSENGNLYVVDGAVLSEFRASDGALLWMRKGVMRINSLQIINGLIYVSTDSSLYTLSEHDHSFVWTNSSGFSYPSVAHGIVYTGNIALRERDGTVLWNKDDQGNTPGAGIMVDGIIYTRIGSEFQLGTSSNSFPDVVLAALNSKDGSTLWEQDIYDNDLQTPQLDHGILFVPTSRGKVYAFLASNGTFLWMHNLGLDPVESGDSQFLEVSNS